MPRRFTLSECYQVLDVDPKTFRSWLQKAGIEPQVSKADPRVKYLAEEQVRFLAKEHERDFERNLERAKHRPEVIPPSAYKLLVDQVILLERQAVDFGQRQAGMYEELAGNIAAAEERQKQASEGLLASVTAFVNEVRQAVDQEHQQREALEARFQQQTGQVEQVQRDIAGSQEDLRVVRTQSEAAEARQLQALQETRQAFTLAQRQATDELRQEMGKLFEQRVREVYQALESLSKEVAADVATMTERLDREEARMEQFTTQLDALKGMALGVERRVDAQDQVMAELREQIQSEVQAREALAEQVAALIAERAGGKPRKKLEA